MAQKSASTTKVVIKVFGSLRSVLGSEMELEITGHTLNDLIEELAKRKGAQVKEELLDEEGKLDYAYMLFINGQRVNELSASLPEKTDLTITNMFGGGS